MPVANYLTSGKPAGETWLRRPIRRAKRARSQPFPAEGVPSEQIIHQIYVQYPTFNNPSHRCGNPVSRIVGTSGKRLFNTSCYAFRLKTSLWLKSCRLTALLFWPINMVLPTGSGPRRSVHIGVKFEARQGLFFFSSGMRVTIHALHVRSRLPIDKTSAKTKKKMYALHSTLEEKGSTYCGNPSIFVWAALAVKPSSSACSLKRLSSSRRRDT